MIENNKDKTLPLFITSKLSDNQWYILLNKAQIHNVQLEIYLAPNIPLPEKVKHNKLNFIPPESTSKSLENIPTIIVSNDAGQTIRGLGDNYVVIDLEDVTSEDLTVGATFETFEGGFNNFEKTRSDLITALKQGKKIILKGRFDPELLQILEPFLSGKEINQFDDVDIAKNGFLSFLSSVVFSDKYINLKRDLTLIIAYRRSKRFVLAS
ncbi:MAG: hypothetical protein ACJAW3_000133 [Lentimonas sp.]